MTAKKTTAKKQKMSKKNERHNSVWAKYVVVGISIAALLCAVIALAISIYLLHR